MDKKISQLTAATTPLTGAEELAIVQSGVTKKTTIEDVKGYKVYTALLTQSGGSQVYSTQSAPLTVGVTYMIFDSIAGDDFRNVGGPLIVNNNDFNNTYFVATGTNPTNWVGETGLEYNTGAPVVTVLENTIGNIWFTYNNVGGYQIKSDGLFTLNKTAVFPGILDMNPGTPNLSTDHYVNDVNTYLLFTSDQFGSAQNEFLYNTPIEIRVYN